MTPGRKEGQHGGNLGAEEVDRLERGRCQSLDGPAVVEQPRTSRRSKRGKRCAYTLPHSLTITAVFNCTLQY